jgi:phosphoglycolate phosphatase-like HAD superfamily hydrolase
MRAHPCPQDIQFFLSVSCGSHVFNFVACVLVSLRYAGTLRSMGVTDEACIARFVALHLADASISRWVKFSTFFEREAQHGLDLRSLLCVHEDGRARDNSTLVERCVLAAVHGYGQECLKLYASLLPNAHALQFAARVGAARICVVSGGAEEELHEVFATHHISRYFAQICGSPTTKPVHVQRLCEHYFGTAPSDPEAARAMCGAQSLFVGDGWTDLKTAEAFGLPFVFLGEMSDWADADIKCREAQARGVDVTMCATWSDLLARLY